MPNNNHERIRQIKSHINQLLLELRRIDPNCNSPERFQSLNCSLTTISHEKCLLDHQCPYLSHHQAIFHSTTYHEYKKLQQRQKHYFISPKRNLLAVACATSTPKQSPNENILLKPHLTSTPRRYKRSSTNSIPLKRLLYNQKNKESNRQRYSTKRSRHPIEENPQWI